MGKGVGGMAKRFFSIFLILLFLWNLGGGAEAEEKKAPGDAEYAGAEVCSSCHADLAKSFHRSKHGKIFAQPRNEREKKGCEACHGPASAHLEDPTTGVLRFSRAEAKIINATCLTCHNSGESTRKWEKGIHSRAQLSCISCHKVHPDEEHLLVKQEPDVCLTCHKTVQASFRMPSRHPLKERKVLCSQCHNPHQPEIPPTATSLQQSCVSCHQEKRGPFRFPHRPVSFNCLSCHLPHSSTNPDLLTLRQPSLCLQCHTSLPETHNLSNPQNRQCTSCHKDIHGSNKNKRYFP